jgi:sugar-specific transcriptional regulator TrmB
MDKKEVIELFKNLNLGDYESKTYSALIFLGPSKVSEISRESKVPQSKIYEVLERLMAKELVEVYGVRPKEFKAVHPNIILKSLLDEKEKELTDMKQKMDVLSNFLKQTNPKSEVMEGVWTTKEDGWKSFINKLTDMFDRADKYIYVVSRDFSWTSRLGQSVKSCYKRGIEIKTIFIGNLDESNYQRGKWFNDHGVRIKTFKSPIHPRIILIDGKEILIRLDTNPTKRDRFSFTSIWSKDFSLAKVFDVYMKNLWKESKNINFDKIIKQNSKGAMVESYESDNS